MDIARLPRLCLTLLLPLVVIGCSGIEPEPDSAYSSLPPQAYDFDTVWECLIEAAEDLDFQIGDSSRDGEYGDFATEFVITFSNTLKNSEQGQRLRATIEPAGDQFSVSLAASRFSRKSRGNWDYDRPDDELRARFEAAFHMALGKRYQPKPSDDLGDF